MGYMRHHAIVITTFDKQKALKAHEVAKEYFDGDTVKLVTPIMTSAVNTCFTFVITPDGSKEGWAESESGDVRRENMIRWMESQRYEDHSSPYDWAEVQYGDDRGETKIVNDSDAWKRRRKNGNG